jgi:hypothetical protein
VAIATVRGSSADAAAWSCWNATISLTAMRVPRTPPTVVASDQGMPISAAIGAKPQPSTRSIDSGAPNAGTRPTIALSSDTRATNEISIAPTLAARRRPSLVPLAAASRMLRLLSTGASRTTPAVSGVPVSGTISLANTREIGAVIAIAVRRCSIFTPPNTT